MSISSSRPRSLRRSSVTPDLFELSIANGAPVPLPTARPRRLSPHFGSTLITRAPPSAISSVAYGAL